MTWDRPWMPVCHRQALVDGRAPSACTANSRRPVGRGLAPSERNRLEALQPSIAAPGQLQRMRGAWSGIVSGASVRDYPDNGRDDAKTQRMPGLNPLHHNQIWLESHVLLLIGTAPAWEVQTKLLLP
jgi:hypothetical protein